jgi:hypothetical protein
MTVAERVAERIECFAGNIIDIPESLRICQETDRILSIDMGCFRIMTPKDGDKRVIWCRNVIAEIKAAKNMFLDLIAQGMVPYRVGVDGQATAEVMDEFDATAEEIIFMPVRAIAGG